MSTKIRKLFMQFSRSLTIGVVSLFDCSEASYITLFSIDANLRLNLSRWRDRNTFISTGVILASFYISIILCFAAQSQVFAAIVAYVIVNMIAVFIAIQWSFDHSLKDDSMQGYLLPIGLFPYPSSSISIMGMPLVFGKIAICLIDQCNIVVGQGYLNKPGKLVRLFHSNLLVRLLKPWQSSVAQGLPYYTVNLILKEEV